MYKKNVFLNAFHFNVYVSHCTGACVCVVCLGKRGRKKKSKLSPLWPR